MKLKLRVFNPLQPKIKPIENDGRWNLEKEFEIPERIILKLVEELTDIMSNDQFYKFDTLKRLRRKIITYGDVDKIIRTTRTWKKIHVMISDQGFETSRFTRISLFENMLDKDILKNAIRERIEKIEALKYPLKTLEKKSQNNILPNKKNNVTTKNVMEFIEKSID